jgi:Tfp pilus assembly protein PilV
MRAKLAGPRRGLSLIDLMVGITLLALGIVGVAGAFGYAASASHLAEETIVAENLVSGLLAEARTADYQSLSSWYTYAGESGVSGLEAEFSERLTRSDLEQARVWFTVTDVQPDLKGVSATLTWGTGLPGGQVETETLVSPRY